MAKPITPTPPVTGEAARRIHEEVLRGTPDTPQRVATIQRADEVYRRAVEESRTPRTR